MRFYPDGYDFDVVARLAQPTSRTGERVFETLLMAKKSALTIPLG